MKKASVFITVLFIMGISFTSCTKTIDLTPPQHNFTVKTDNPPDSAGLFPPGTTYGQIQNCYLSKQMFDLSIMKGYNCNNVWDNNTMQWSSFDCGYWHLIPATAYWGQIIKNGDTTTYYGLSTMWYSITEHDYVLASDLIKYNGQALATVSYGNYYYNNGYSYWNNPIGANARLVNVRQK